MYNQSLVTHSEHYAGGILIYNPNQGSIIDGLTIDNNQMDSSSNRGVGGLFIKNDPSKTNMLAGLNVSNSLITNNTVLGSGANVFDTSGDMICDQCTFQSNNGNNINIVSWEAVNSFNNRKLEFLETIPRPR